MTNVLKRRGAKQVGGKGSVMTPIGWMCGVTEAVLLPTMAASHDNWVGKFCAILVVFVFLFYAMAYFYFAIKDPDRLQTEQYQLASLEITSTLQGPVSPQITTPQGQQPTVIQAQSPTTTNLIPP